MLRRRPELPEPPTRRTIVQVRMDLDAYGTLVGIVKTETMQRQRQAHASRFDVRLFESPVLEESILLQMRWNCSERRDFIGSKKSVRDIEQQESRSKLLHIDAD